MESTSGTPTLTDLIADAEKALRMEDEHVVKAEMRLDTAIRQRDRARTYLAQLVEVAKGAGIKVQPEGIDAIRTASTLKEAVRLALADFPNSVTTRKLQGYLAEHGRRDHPASVAAALSVAKQRGEIEGWWDGSHHFWRLP